MPTFHKHQLLRPSIVVMVAANLVPLFGVFALGWSVLSIMLLYWIENFVIGVFAVVKMILCPESTWDGKRVNKPNVIVGFCVWYGVFWIVQGFVLLVLFGNGMELGGALPSFSRLKEAVRHGWPGWVAVAFVVSHGFSLFWNHIRSGAYRTIRLKRIQDETIGPLLFLHAVVVIGGILVGVCGILMGERAAPVAGLVFLVALKIVVDASVRVNQQRKSGIDPSQEWQMILRTFRLSERPQANGR